jgi:Gpi18-like mannosyltransferase
MSQNHPTVAFPAVPWREIAVDFAASRFLILAVGVLAFLFLPKGAYFLPHLGVPGMFERWDTAWYLDVARNGYYLETTRSNAVFFPLYPTLIRLGAALGLDWRVAGYAVSNAALLGACGLLWRLTLLETGCARTARRAVQFLLFGPVSFFLSTIYSEAVFLFTLLAAFYCARANRWWLAGLGGFLAGTTRFVGLMAAVPLLWEFCRQHPFGSAWRRPTTWRHAALCLLPVLGAGFVMALMWLQFDDPLVYFRAQQFWGRKLSGFWRFFTTGHFLDVGLFYQVWFAGTVLLAFALLLVGALLRVRDTWLVLGLAYGITYVSSTLLDSLPRYFTVVFPLYLILAVGTQRWPRLTAPLLAGSAALLALSVVLFVNG